MRYAIKQYKGLTSLLRYVASYMLEYSLSAATHQAWCENYYHYPNFTPDRMQETATDVPEFYAQCRYDSARVDTRVSVYKSNILIQHWTFGRDHDFDMDIECVNNKCKRENLFYIFICSNRSMPTQLFALAASFVVFFFFFSVFGATILCRFIT